MYDIFLSYSTQDRQRLQPLVEYFRQQGWTVFWDHQNVGVGGNWRKEIEAALLGSTCVVVAWSRQSVESQWVIVEALNAVKRKVMLPLAIDPIAMPFGFELYQAAQLADWHGQPDHPELEKLCRQIRQHIQTRQQEQAEQARFDALEQQTRALAAKETELLEKTRAADAAHARAVALQEKLARQQAGLQTPAPSSGPKSSQPVVMGVAAVLALGGAVAFFTAGGSSKSPESPSVSNPAPAVATPPPPATPAPAAIPRENTNSLGITMVTIDAGNFVMGCQIGRDQNCESDESPSHSVSLSAFELGKTEVTQGQWKAVMGSAPPELYFKDCGDTCPVENVSWDNIQTFIQKLNAQTGKTYRLPSEAEWEYACRAGQSQNYCGSDNVDSVAWYSNNSGSKTHPVGGKAANAWGLYDMSGNVYEWVQDGYHSNYDGAPKDGEVWSGATERRVLRGGSWFINAGVTRAAIRGIYAPAVRNSIVGFRLARTPQ